MEVRTYLVKVLVRKYKLLNVINVTFFHYHLTQGVCVFVCNHPPPKNQLFKWILQILFLHFLYLEKGAPTIKPSQIERSGFFLLDHNGQTHVYRLVSGALDVWIRRNRDSPIE